MSDVVNNQTIADLTRLKMADLLPAIFEKMDYLDDGFVDG